VCRDGVDVIYFGYLFVRLLCALHWLYSGSPALTLPEMAMIFLSEMSLEGGCAPGYMP
jgi:hypothetical protein